MKNDIEKFDSLPFRESRAAYITRSYGNMYDIHKFDHGWYRSDKSDYAWVKAERVIKKFIGKNYGKAFSAYCELVEKYEQNVFYDDFFKKTGRWEPEYSIDKQNRIQINKAKLRQDAERRAKRKERGVTFVSIDYETAFMHKQTGEILSRKDYHSNIKFDWGRHAYIQDNNYVEVIVSGFAKHFKSEKDPEYVRLNAEKIKQKALYRKIEKKEKRAKAYEFMTKDEVKRKKLDALDAQKIQAHGFGEESFKGIEYHGQKRKLK
jgi:hypothetical protein